MGALFLAIAVAAGAALCWWLAGPVAAVPLAFFGLWGTLVLWAVGRVPAGDLAPAQEREAEIKVPI
jgi:hypothetical protein